MQVVHKYMGVLDKYRMLSDKYKWVTSTGAGRALVTCFTASTASSLVAKVMKA